MFYVVMLTDLGNVGSLARVSHHDSGRNQFLRSKTPIKSVCFRGTPKHVIHWVLAQNACMLLCWSSLVDITVKEDWNKYRLYSTTYMQVVLKYFMQRSKHCRFSTGWILLIWFVDGSLFEIHLSYMLFLLIYCTR